MPVSFPSRTSSEFVRRWWTSWSPSGTGWWVRTDPTRPCPRPLSLEDDAVEMCAAVYALPDQFRERGRSGTPLLWPWPWDLLQNGLSRRDELLLGAAMLLIAAERLDHQVPGREQRHLQAVSATVPEVGQQ